MASGTTRCSLDEVGNFILIKVLRIHRSELLNYMASPDVWLDTVTTHSVPGPGVSLEVFDRRIPFYRKTMDFVRLVCRGGDLGLGPIMKFSADTDEVLFLFGDKVASYLAWLLKQAVRLRYVSKMTGPPEHRTPELTREWADLMLWFTNQFNETRRVFVPYLRLESPLHVSEARRVASKKRSRRSR